jgi:hypothetical protein
MLESLAKFLIVPPNAPQPGAWVPEWVAEHHWKPIAFQIFASADTQEHALRCQILLVGISNKIDPEVAANPRAVQMPRACIVRFSCPDFEPVIKNTRLSVDHIGSGGAPHLAHSTHCSESRGEQPMHISPRGNRCHLDGKASDGVQFQMIGSRLGHGHLEGIRSGKTECDP